MTQQAAVTDRYFEDLALGERWLSPPVTLTEQDIIDFGRLYDPQPLHVDPLLAADGPFGGLVASGWQVAALVMRLNVEGRSFGSTPMVGAGIDELRWRQPVRPGDTLTVEREIVGLQPPNSPGGRGGVRSTFLVRNQRGETVMTMTALSRIPLRPQPPGSAPPAAD